MLRTLSLAATLALTWGAVDAAPAAGKTTGLDRARAAHAATAERLATKPKGTKGHAKAAEKRGKGLATTRPAPEPQPTPEPTPIPTPEPAPETTPSAN